MEGYKITLCGVELSVDFLITGQDRPATWLQPEEHREVEISKIMIGDVNAYDFALNYGIIEELEKEIAEEFLC